MGDSCFCRYCSCCHPCWHFGCCHDSLSCCSDYYPLDHGCHCGYCRHFCAL
ncbi:hypothetical protein EVA_18649 [gut metagenome]|uniref:Uncharacterized protein n=1 Tax=gut metagenome TaxID=749906 RepID=J9FFN1_9ZZZZ